MATHWTIGICHPAYRIAPLLRDRLPEARVFQESALAPFRPRMCDVDILVISGAWDDDLLAEAARLRWIQSIGVGFDQFPLADLRRRRIRLTNAAGVNSNAVSEHAMALVLSLARRLGEARDNQRRRFWRPMIGQPSQREFELRRKIMGIVGLGGIGNRLAALAKAFGMTVIGTKRDPATYRGPADEVLPADGLASLLERSDIVVLACPLTSETANLIGADQLRRLGPNGYLVNVARGAIVDEGALVDALVNARIAGAALDVTVEEPLAPESPLWEMPNVVLTPHTAGETANYEAALTDIIVENVAKLEGSGPLRNEII
jgi:phosphoglycerate dehydrogenase-like enzyme